jgi:transcriptional regulator with XRE-family HTH domain
MRSKTTRPSTGKVGAFIRERREHIDMSRTTLAEKLGYEFPNMITMVELGRIKFPTNRWTDYADALSVPRHKFLEVVIGEAYPEAMPFITFHPEKKTPPKND